jgi:hypothetical protein
MHPNADFSNVMNGKESNMKFWSKYHQTTEDPEKEQKFLSDVDRYKSKVQRDKAESGELLAQNKFKNGGILYHK